MAPPRRRHNAPTHPPFTAGNNRGKNNSGTSTVVQTPTTETPPKDPKDIKVDTNVTSAIPNPGQFNQLSPSVRDVAEHAAVLKSVLSRLGPIYDLVEREATRMAEVSPLLAAKDQVRHASVVAISDTKTLCRPGRRGEKSPSRRCGEARGENKRHQGND